MSDFEKEEEEIIDSDVNYSLKSPFSKGEIAKDQVNRCLIAQGKEMRKGYYNTSISNSGEEIREYIQDTRKAFISSVKALKSLLYPEIIEKDSENIKKTLIDLEEEEEKLFEKYCYKEKKLVDGKPKETGEKYIPEEDDYLLVKIIDNSGIVTYEKKKGVWNEISERYWNKLVELYNQVFAELNNLIHDLDYFNPESAGY